MSIKGSHQVKKRLAICVCVVLGLVAGYIAAPIASMAFVESKDREMFGGFALFTLESFMDCNCTNQPPGERLQDLSKHLSTLQKWRQQNPKSRVLSQVIGLGYVRISLLETQLDQNAPADEAMKRAGEELRSLGWKDVSPAHLTALVVQLDSECGTPEQKSKTTAIAATR
jgi:hypothetical protein